jgi:hypothetical protein
MKSELRHKLWLVAASAVAVAIAGGVSYASIPSRSDGMIYSCYSQATGT